MLDWFRDPALRRRVQAGLNKGEARNALAVHWVDQHGKTVLVAYIDGNNNYLVSIVKNDTKYQIEDVMLLNQYRDVIEVQDLADILK